MDLDVETLRFLQEEFQNDFSPSETLSDSLLARQLQEQFSKETIESPKSHLVSSDSDLAKRLQAQFEQEILVDRPTNNLVYTPKKKNREDTKSLVDPSWEVIDPTPDIHVLFIAFNSKFFWGKLGSVCVSWSKRMKRCAGICSYQGAGGMCHITLSEPLLKLRPRKDLVETLLHEMIHAYLFVTHNNRDRDGHGPEFHKHMYRINGEAGTNITVYHDFHDEVRLYLQHWWRCDGPCQNWKPYFGMVRRSMNRAPGPNDRWWGEHSRNCGGTFTKIKSPEPKEKEVKKGKENKPSNDIRKFLSPLKQPGASTEASTSKNSSKATNINTISKPQAGLATAVTISSKTNNIHGFTSSGNKSKAGQKGGVKNSSNTIVINQKTKTVEPEKNIETKSSASTSIKSETPINYDVVRNHWVNKFSQSDDKVTSIKRKSSGNVPTTLKSPKLELPESQNSESSNSEPLTSQEFANFQSATCPVCSKSILIDDLNDHLDNCLNSPKKECVICCKMIEISDYDQHIKRCLANSFKDDEEDDDVFIVEPKNESVDDVNEIQCAICENTVPLDDLGEHLKICRNRGECPECKKKIDPSTYDVHLAECLMKKFDSTTKKLKSDNEIEMVECLACGTNIPKESLTSHLDDCLNSLFKDEMSQQTVVENEMINCPFCLKLIHETQMSQHIGICLQSIDDEEKSILLSDD